MLFVVRENNIFICKCWFRKFLTVIIILIFLIEKNLFFNNFLQTLKCVIRSEMYLGAETFAELFWLSKLAYFWRPSKLESSCEREIFFPPRAFQRRLSNWSTFFRGRTSNLSVFPFFHILYFFCFLAQAKLRKPMLFMAWLKVRHIFHLFFCFAVRNKSFWIWELFMFWR